MKLDHAMQCIEANKHNSTTTGYYLLLKKHLRNGGSISAQDLVITSQPAKTRSLSISIQNEPQPPLLRLSYDKEFKPIYPKRSESANNKTSSMSYTPVREKISISVLDNKKKNLHQRTTSQIVKQNNSGRIAGNSPQRENIKPEYRKAPRRAKIIKNVEISSNSLGKGMSNSFRYTPRSASSTNDNSKPTSFTRKLFISK